MSTMMQAYPSKTFVDDEMKPLVSGRLTVYVHDSNVKADVFTLEGANYVPCDNPMRLDEAGRLVASIFTELGVYDVKLEKYNGDGTFEDFDHYEIGIDAKLDQIGRDSVNSIEDLMNLVWITRFATTSGMPSQSTLRMAAWSWTPTWLRLAAGSCCGNLPT